MFSTLLGLLFWLTPLDTGSMLSASMEAHVAANSTVIVTARYRLHKPDGPSSLTLRTLHPFETAPGAISVDVGGEPASLTLLPAQASKASAWQLDVPESSQADTLLMVTLQYEVPQGFDTTPTTFSFTAPIIYPDWPAASEQADFFTASIILPDTLSVENSFPTNFRAVNDTDYAYSLHILPSFVRMTGRSGPQRWLTFNTFVDILLILLMAAMGWFTWYHMTTQHHA